MFKRKLVTAVITVALAGVPGVASAATTGGSSLPDSPGQVVINGRTFGPEDGLVTETGVITLSGGVPSARVTTQSEASTASSILSKTSKTSWGASYAASTETVQLRYTGKAYAAANIYSSKRVIKVCFKYKRGTVELTGWVCSTANDSSGRWAPGGVASKSLSDSLKLNAPKTTFHYQTQMINPNVL